MKFDHYKNVQFTMIISCDDQSIEVQFATINDYELIYENLKEFMGDKSLIEKDSLESKLIELKSLYDKEILTEEEYELKRKQIIDKYYKNTF